MKTTFTEFRKLVASTFWTQQLVKHYHYQVRGNDFQIVHELMQEFYEYLDDKIDLLNERLVQEGYKPVVSLVEIIDLRNNELNDIDETKIRSNEIYNNLILDFEILKKQLNELISYYVACGDVKNTTNEDILREFKAWIEKQIWMIKNSL